MKLETRSFSGIYQLRSEQIITASLDEVWDFFSSPKNLDRITPDTMKFEITSKILSHTYEGQIITYKIEILPGITSPWVTEITHFQDKRFFVDEQRFGPYRMWHHEHHFSETHDGKVVMTDIVSYKLPMGFLGRICAGRMIRKKVERIFTHRFKIIDQFFAD